MSKGEGAASATRSASRTRPTQTDNKKGRLLALGFMGLV